MHNILLSFGVIILCGLLFRRIRPAGLDADTLRHAITTSVFNLFFPTLCVNIIYRTDINIETLLVPLTAWITLIVSLGLSWVLYALWGRRFRLEPSEKGVLILSSTFGNVAYLGLPVLTGIYGPEAAKYAIYYGLLATTPFLWLAGVAVASHYGKGEPFKISNSIKTIISLPPIWGIAAGMVLKTFNIQLPDFLLRVLELLGGLVVPLMIFSIGLALSLPETRHIVSILPAIGIKLFLVPLISFTVANLLGLEGKALASCLIEGAMPTMVLSLLVAAKFNLDVRLAALSILITTTLSFATLPVAISLAGTLF